MPSLNDNVENWNSTWDWSAHGDDWSDWWGGTEAMWHGVLLPRIHAIVPTGTILEIAPGYGRWTQYLKDLCQRLVIVDLTESCITYCQQRFATADNVTYHQNDGKSLEMVENESIDFVFSFDSLVHADPDIIGIYLTQLAHKLRPDGIGLVHHSNAGSLRLATMVSRKLPHRLLGPLARRGIAVNLGAWRDDQMTAALFRQQCESAGLSCVTQELVSWQYGAYLLDSFSFLTRPGSKWDRPQRLIRNPAFVAEARRMVKLYAGSHGSEGTSESELPVG